MWIPFWFLCLALVDAALPQNEAEILGPDLAVHYRHLEMQLRSSKNSVVSEKPADGLTHKVSSSASTPASAQQQQRSRARGPASTVSGMLNGRQTSSMNSITSDPVTRAKKQKPPSKPTSQFRTSDGKTFDGDEDAWPHRDDPTKAAEAAAAPIINAVSTKTKPRMLNAPKVGAVRKSGGNPQHHPINLTVPTSSKSVPAEGSKSVPAEGHKKWEKFKALVKGSAHLQNSEFLHDGFKIRGLSAVSSMEAGMEILRVPAGLVLSKANPALQNFYSGIAFEEPSDPTWKLVSFLAAQKRLGARSPWGPYVAHLPKLSDFRVFHPLWASEDLLQLFAPLPLLHNVREYRRRVRTEWREWQSFSHVLEKKLADGTKSDPQTEALRKAALGMTEDDIQWAFSVVLTRGFGTPQGSALAPVADDLNTDNPFKLNVQWHGQQDGSVQLKTTASVSKGDELLTSYSAGLRNNDDFASSFGFALRHNADVVGRLAPRACTSMAKAVKSRYGAEGPKDTEKCTPPASEQQPAVFCTLLALAKEHCPQTKFD